MKNKFSIAISLAMIVAMMVTSLALADNVQNDVTAGGNDTFTVGGSTTVNYRIAANSGDGQSGCNAADATPATVTINAPAAVTATPGSLSFTSCGTDKPVVFTASAAGDYDITVSVSDGGAGTYNTNPAKFTLHVQAAPPPADTTVPVITPSVVGTLGENGWYVSDVTVSWLVQDSESSISSSSGCGSTTINADTAGVTLTCTATSAGGTSSQSVTIRRDASDPSISAGADPGPNTNGWNNGDVTVSYSCTDNGPSGVDTTASDLDDDLLSTSGTATGTCVDMAGNSDSADYTAQIDKDAPVVTASPDPIANANGWNNTNVTVSYSCDDGSGSGVDTAASDLDDDVLSASGTATGTCVDMAGNSASDSYTAQIDKVAPTASASAAPAPNANGWNNTNVSVSFSGNDGSGSGIDFCDEAVVLSGEGAGQLASGTCTDKAGNASAPAMASGINIDKTAPVFGACPAAGPFLLGSGLQSVGPISVDASISGLNAGASTLSGSVDTSSIGLKTVNFSAVDNADNSAPKGCSYSVIYNFLGFFQPIDNLPVLNKAKAGSAIPVKFSLSGNQGLNIFATGYPVSTVTACGTTTTDVVETTVTAGSSSLSYDALADQYVYVWKTDKAWAGTCRTLTVKLADGTIHQANFNFTK